MVNCIYNVPVSDKKLSDLPIQVPKPFSAPCNLYFRLPGSYISDMKSVLFTVLSVLFALACFSASAESMCSDLSSGRLMSCCCDTGPSPEPVSCCDSDDKSSLPYPSKACFCSLTSDTSGHDYFAILKNAPSREQVPAPFINDSAFNHVSLNEHLVFLSSDASMECAGSYSLKTLYAPAFILHCAFLC